MALRENLELDIAEALRGVDRLEATLTQTAQGFKVQLGEALTALAVTVDVSAVPAEISAAVDAADSTVVIVGEAESITGVIDEAVGEADPTVVVEVEADTAAAQAEIDALAGSVEGLGEQATAAEGGVGGLADGTGGLGRGAGLALGATAALTGGVVKLFSAAVDAEGSLQSFNLRTGEFAAQVRNVDVGGLNEDIGTLAIRLGSSDEGLQNSAAAIFELGTASGIAGPQVAETTNQITALAARAVALNPQLGDVGDVAQAMSQALARGGRTTARFGIALTAAEIEARALADTGKTAAEDLTIYDKAAAGAAITTERLGDTLATDVNAGAENATLTLRSLQERLGEVVETAGAPIVLPLFAAFEEALPAITPILEALGQLAVDAIPVLISGLQGALPVLQLMGTVFGALSPEIVQAAGVLLIVAKGAAIAGKAMIAFGVDAQAAGKLVALSNPILLGVTAALSAFAIVSSTSKKRQQELAAEVDSTSEALIAQASAAGEAFEGLITDKLLSGTDGLAEKLRTAGVTAEGLADALRGGDDATEAYLGSVEELNDLSVKEFAELARVTEGLTEGSRAAFIAAQATGTFTEAQGAAALAANGLASGTVDYVAALEQATGAAEAESEAEARRAATLAALAGPSLDASGAAADLATKILSGTAAASDFEAAAEAMGVETSELTALQGHLTEAVDSFVSDAVSKFPTVGEAIRDLNDDGKVTLDEFTANLLSQSEQIDLYGASLVLAMEGGLTNLAALLTNEGPSIVGPDGPLHAALVSGNQADLAALDASLANYGTHVTSIGDVLRAAAPGLGIDAAALAQKISDDYGVTLDLTTGIEDQTPEVQAALAAEGIAVKPAAEGAGAAVKGGFEEGADFEAAVRTAVRLGATELDATSTILAPKALIAGRAVGRAFDDGIAVGIISNAAVVRQAARSVVQQAESAARDEAGIASPSKLFADAVGAPISAGIAQGIGDSAGVVAGAARSVVAAGAVAVGGTSTTTTGGGVQIGTVDIDVHVQGSMSEAQADAVGASLADGFERRLTARQITVDARML